MNSSYARLGVNIDHVATLRNARGGKHPCPISAAKLAIKAGADGITAHLREDRRHINDADIFALSDLCKNMDRPLNFEMAAVDEMAKIACNIKPHAVCLVPEKREERTTEGGLDVAGLYNQIIPIISKIKDSGARISLFIEAQEKQVEFAAKSGADIVEFHTGAYAECLDNGKINQANKLLNAMQKGAKQASDLSLEVHFGHGLNFDNIDDIAKIPEAKEFNIGHFLIGESVFFGLENVIKQMRAKIDKARADL